MQLEEGEIEDNSDDGLDPYTPLERPGIVTAVKEPPPIESDDESEPKYSSNSDSEEDFRPKRAKMRRIVHPPKRKTNKKYSVWCRDPNDHLTDFLGCFEMDNRQNDRNVENYPLPFNNDRKRKKAVRKELFEPAKLNSIVLEELKCSEMSTFESLAKEIAEKLSEENYDLVLRIVVVCGKEKAIEFYNRTRIIESDGGLLIANKSRRRTSGGVFIYIVRMNKSITKEQKREIFEDTQERSKISKNHRKKKERQQKYKDWLEKMNYDKEMESGQEELNNPPPSPEPHCPQPLPELRLRRDIITYSDLNLHHSTDSDDAGPNPDHLSKPQVTSFHPSDVDELTETVRNSFQNSKKQASHTKDSPLKREVVDYDDLCSMELIYD